jgi:hydrogenase nickel incorporation protein HypA/HybF
MHEVGLVQGAVQTAIDVMRAAGADSVERVTFAIAPGGHVTEGAIATLFAALSVGTPVEGAQIAFEAMEGQYGCWACGQQFRAAEQPQACPTCGASSVSRFASPDVVLRYVDVPERAAELHACHEARTDHLRGELARAGRRRTSFMTR